MSPYSRMTSIFGAILVAVRHVRRLVARESSLLDHEIQAPVDESESKIRQASALGVPYLQQSQTSASVLHANSPGWMRLGQRQAGFSLMEMSIVLMIVGVLSAGGLRWMQQARAGQAARLTHERQSTAFLTLAQYFARTGHLPLPCDPLGDRGSWGHAADAWPEGRPLVGGFPFVTLGLSADTAKDGHGRWMTYAVDAFMTLHGRTDKAAVCHETFRYPSALDIQDGYRSSVQTHLGASDAHGRGRRPNFRSNAAASSARGWGARLGTWQEDAASSHNIGNGPFAPETPPLQAAQASRDAAFLPGPHWEGIAIILVAHGPTGGAYRGPLADADARRFPLTSLPQSPCKRTNCADKGVFCAEPRAAESGYYDDTVQWWTRSQVLAKAGLACADVFLAPVPGTAAVSPSCGSDAANPSLTGPTPARRPDESLHFPGSYPLPSVLPSRGPFAVPSRDDGDSSVTSVPSQAQPSMPSSTASPAHIPPASGASFPQIRLPTGVSVR